MVHREVQKGFTQHCIQNILTLMDPPELPMSDNGS